MSGIPTSSETPGPVLRAPWLRCRRTVFFGLVLTTALAGITTMTVIVATHGFGPLQLIILVLFAGVFTWIANAFWNAVVGFVLLALRLDPLSLRPCPASATTSLQGRTALVMPVHNEEPERVMQGLEATCRSLHATGHIGAFDAFLLSDTTNPIIAAAEEEAFAELKHRLAGVIRLDYRRRPFNTGRKAGNIADFCAHQGQRYDYMVVLDADSIMRGDTLTTLVRTMDANPRSGLLQTVPMPVRQRTLFGRFFQFAAALYSPMLGASISFWSGNAANYWGHNAIIRVRPFARHCRLPLLPGGPPLGGEILSHDFVEAALMKRAGWDVWLLPLLGGSYEELPGNLLDYAKRDRRWTQGNLQHLRLLRSPGLHAMNRLHFIQGAMSYTTSLLWLLLLLATTVAAGASAMQWWSGAGADAAPVVAGLTPAGLAQALLAVTLFLLLVPRLLGTLLALARQPASFGGRVRLAGSGLLEALFSILVAPLMMLFHSRFILSVLAGRNTRWDAQQREGRPVPWSDAFARTGIMALLSLLWAVVLILVAPSMLGWFAPVLPGLIAAPWLVRMTSSVELGERMRKAGWLLVPAEVDPDRVLQGMDGCRVDASRGPVAAATDAPVRARASACGQ